MPGIELKTELSAYAKKLYQNKSNHKFAVTSPFILKAQWQTRECYLHGLDAPAAAPAAPAAENFLDAWWQTLAKHEERLPTTWTDAITSNTFGRVCSFTRLIVWQTKNSTLFHGVCFAFSVQIQFSILWPKPLVFWLWWSRSLNLLSHRKRNCLMRESVT